MLALDFAGCRFIGQQMVCEAGTQAGYLLSAKPDGWPELDR
jgi:hypothetical protein